MQHWEYAITCGEVEGDEVVVACAWFNYDRRKPEFLATVTDELGKAIGAYLAKRFKEQLGKPIVVTVPKREVYNPRDPLHFDTFIRGLSGETFDEKYPPMKVTAFNSGTPDLGSGPRVRDDVQY